MSNILTIGIGAAPNDTTGDPLRTSMTKIMTAVNGLAGNFSGTSAPSSLMPYQSWFDTSTNPATLRYYDGTQWVAVGTLNQSTHVWVSLAAPGGNVGGDLTGAWPNPTIAALAVTGAKLAAGAASSNIGPLSGDLTGSLPTQTIAKIQGTTIAGVSGSGNILFSASPTLTGLATFASSTITTAPSLTIAPTGNPLTTLTSHNVQGSSSSSTTIEFMSAIGFAMNTGSAGVFVTNDAKVAQYVGGTVSSGCKAGWAVNHLMTLNTPLNANLFVALTDENDFNNLSGNNFHNSYGAVGSLTQYVGNLLITGSATSQADFAICIGGVNNSAGHGMYNRGLLFLKDPLGAVQADVQTESSAVSGWADFGTHTYGLDLRASAYSGAGIFLHPVGSSGSGIAASGTYTVAAMSDASTAPYGLNLSGTYATAALFVGGALQVTALSANAAVATALGSVGPTGSHTTVQEWIQIKGTGGAIRYIPGF